MGSGPPEQQWALAVGLGLGLSLLGFGIGAGLESGLASYGKGLKKLGKSLAQGLNHFGARDPDLNEVLKELDDADPDSSRDRDRAESARTPSRTGSVVSSFRSLILPGPAPNPNDVFLFGPVSLFALTIGLPKTAANST